MWSLWWHELGEVENECTLYNFSLFAIFVPKIIKVGGNLTKFWRKQFWLFFETRCMYVSAQNNNRNSVGLIARDKSWAIIISFRPNHCYITAGDFVWVSLYPRYSFSQRLHAVSMLRYEKNLGGLAKNWGGGLEPPSPIASAATAYRPKSNRWRQIQIWQTAIRRFCDCNMHGDHRIVQVMYRP